MTVALVGGLSCLAGRYRSIAAEHQIDLRVYIDRHACLKCKLGEVDAVIMFTDLVSHQAAKEVNKLARSHGKCVVRHHRSSVTAARRCLKEVKIIAHGKT